MKIVWISDLDLRGSGYMNLSLPLCSGLHNAGHNVKIIGLGYKGEEHPYPFSIIPTNNFQEVFAMLQNLWNMTQFDVLIVALDIPLQIQILHQIQQRPFKYVGIMPIEADPLCFTWAYNLGLMDKALIISEFGTEEAQKMGVNAVHIPIGIDTDAWRMPTPEERKKIRLSMFGIEDDNEFVILTVADNQERKNLSAAMEIFKKFQEKVPNSKQVFVTREFNLVGWNLKDYAQELGITNNFMLFERGMDFRQLWSIYAGSDCFLLTSKAEGLGLPLLEAMAVGLPCIATDCTGMKELLSDGRGHLVDYYFKDEPEKMYRDPFGNGFRYFIDKEKAVGALRYAFSDKCLLGNDILMVQDARKYVEKRNWKDGIRVLLGVLENLKGI